MDFNNKTDRERFGAIMKTWEINFSANMGSSDSEKIQVLNFYMKALETFSIEQIESAAKKLLLTRKYKGLPAIAEIVEAISGSELRIETRSQIQADKILSHLNQYGARAEPVLEDPITKRLMADRWPYRKWAADVLTSELKWWAREFCRAYEAYADADTLPMIEAPLEIKRLISDIGGGE